MKKHLASRFLSLFVLGTLFPNFVFAQIPNDPHVSQWAFKDIGAYSAWDLSTGSRNVVVAVIDNGFDSNHPDLKENVWKNPKEIPNNNIDDDNNGYIDDSIGWNFIPTDTNKDGKIRGNEKKGNNNPVPDVSGLSQEEKDKGFFHHATLVAGLIGAVGNNNKDGAGINWKVSLMNLKVLGNTGVGDYTPLAEAIFYAVNNGASVINISAVGTNSPDLDRAVEYAYEHGVVVVAAAGNNSGNLNTSSLYPACSDAGASSDKQKVLGVSAIDETHHLADFSNFGSDCIDITAPGVHIGSLMRYEPREGLTKEWSDGWNGTSFATPLVSGAAALIKALEPNWKAPEIYEALLKSTHKTPTKDESGYKTSFGFGLLQVDKALRYTIDHLASVHVLKSLALFDTDLGLLETISLDKTITTSTQSYLRKVSFLKAFKNNAETQYVTTRLFQGNNQVTIYSQNWQKLQRWNLPAEAKGKILVDNFISSSQASIVIVPSTEADPLQVFSLDGKKLLSKKVDVAGTYILAANILPGKNLALLSKENNKTFLTILDSNLDEKQKIALPSLGTLLQIDAFDMDGDKTLEYVFLSQKGLNATISMTDEKGKLKGQFPISNTTSASDIQFVIGDFNGDKKDDIITFEKNAKNLILWKTNGILMSRIPVLVSENQKFSLIPII